MTAERRPLVVFCIDGGVPSTISAHGFFTYQRRLHGLPRSTPAPLRTIFPSSTAPAHASFLTGVRPGAHGIVGNRFFGREPANTIRELAANPYASLHPYESTSLTAPSLVDWFADRGVGQVAVHFPQTFSRAVTGIPSLYCLYAPSRQVEVVLGGQDVALAYFDHAVRMRATAVGSGRVSVEAFGQGAPGCAVVEPGKPARVELSLPIGALSLPVALGEAVGDRVGLRVGTAVLVITSGGIVLPPSGPASLEVSYDADPTHDFHEAPSAEWVRDAVLHAVERHQPEVVFARFNQADHAQEFLHWQAVRAGGTEADLARTQILDTYALIDRCAGEIIDQVGTDADYVFFSDHGIDYVETQLAPNAVLDDLGLADRFVFQGDSNIAYLYGAEPPSPVEVRRIVAAGRAVDGTIRLLDESGLRAHGLWTASARTGHLAITCGEHREFVYSSGVQPSLRVRSASHGYYPGSAAMNGFFGMIGHGTRDVPPPVELVDAAAVVRKIWHAGRETPDG